MRQAESRPRYTASPLAVYRQQGSMVKPFHAGKPRVTAPKPRCSLKKVSRADAPIIERRAVSATPFSVRAICDYEK